MSDHVVQADAGWECHTLVSIGHLCFALVVYSADFVCDQGIAHHTEIDNLRSNCGVRRDLNQGTIGDLGSETVLGQGLSIGDIEDLLDRKSVV